MSKINTKVGGENDCVSVNSLSPCGMTDVWSVLSPCLVVANLADDHLQDWCLQRKNPP